jgi:hypothetical protein
LRQEHSEGAGMRESMNEERAGNEDFEDLGGHFLLKVFLNGCIGYLL